MKKMIVGAAALVAAGFLTVSAPTTAEAAQGCGPGAGRDAFGFCRPFWGPRHVYRPVRYGWYGPRYYRPVRYGWHRPHYYRPVGYGWNGGYGYYRPAYRPVVSVGFGFGGGPGLFW
jgi:hypothetical protein